MPFTTTLTAALTTTFPGRVESVLHTIVDASTTATPALDQTTVTRCCVVALLAVILTPIWHITRNAITIAHEGGHALVALLCGRRVNGIQMHSDTSGLTVSQGKSRGIGLRLTQFAGYAAPALWGLACAALVSHGYSTASLWLLVVLLILMLLKIRNAYGLLAVVAAGAGVVVLSWWGSADLRSLAAHVLAWFLLFGAIRPLFELIHQRLTGRAAGSDADQLATTGVPAGLWITVWMAMSVGALWLGYVWMLAL
ncbi:M50 family metallopeptidase [uncultured Bifidobacterium sp.]|uniref:M50 family metallopeptidase n=1 Tax=uncultured Bifidobacterium sp. TaxID=165187 RepID=UPI00262FC758|nr:M50 family metallopeptidase [uncultured Bifidobacterium sp.]